MPSPKFPTAFSVPRVGLSLSRVPCDSGYVIVGCSKTFIAKTRAVRGLANTAPGAQRGPMLATQAQTQILPGGCHEQNAILGDVGNAGARAVRSPALRTTIEFPVVVSQ